MSNSFEFRTRRIDTTPVGEWTAWSSVTFKNGSATTFTFTRPAGEYQMELRKERLGAIRATSSTVFEVSNAASEVNTGTADWTEPVDGTYTSIVSVGGTNYTVNRNATKTYTNFSFGYVLFDSTNTNVPEPRKFAMENNNSAPYTLRTSIVTLGYSSGNVLYSGYTSNLLTRPGNNQVDVFVPSTVAFKLTFVSKGGSNKTAIINVPALP